MSLLIQVGREIARAQAEGRAPRRLYVKPRPFYECVNSMSMRPPASVDSADRVCTLLDVPVRVTSAPRAHFLRDCLRIESIEKQFSTLDTIARFTERYSVNASLPGTLWRACEVIEVPDEVVERNIDSILIQKVNAALRVLGGELAQRWSDLPISRLRIIDDDASRLVAGLVSRPVFTTGTSLPFAFNSGVTRTIGRYDIAANAWDDQQCSLTPQAVNDLYLTDLGLPRSVQVDLARLHLEDADGYPAWFAAPPAAGPAAPAEG